MNSDMHSVAIALANYASCRLLWPRLSAWSPLAHANGSIQSDSDT